MTPDQLAEIRARLAAATPWPWRVAYFGGQHDDEGAIIVGQDDDPVTHTAGRNAAHTWEQYHGNAALIANAPTDLAALLAYVGQLEGLLRDLCEDSRAAAEAVRLRRLFGQVLVACDDPHVKGQSVAADMIRRYIRDALAP